jgi:hypothetical protein
MGFKQHGWFVPVSNGIREAAPARPSTCCLNLPVYPLGPRWEYLHIESWSYRVLVEDDNILDRKVFDRMLRSVGDSPKSAQRALEILEGEEYDWVLSDILMPGMSNSRSSFILLVESRRYL